MRRSHVLIVVAVGLVGFGIWWLAKQGDKQVAEKTVTPVSTAYADSLSRDVLDQAHSIEDAPMQKFWTGKVVGIKRTFLFDGIPVITLMVEADGKVFPCVQVGPEAFMGSAVQMFEVSHREPLSGDVDYNKTYFATPI